MIELFIAVIAAIFLTLLVTTSKVDAAVERKPVTVTNARWYPLYHIAPPAGWSNDPNGFCVYKGQYHFFYQHYPYASTWRAMHWGHVVSNDLVHWKHLPVALEPDKIYDASEYGGCFSGSALERDGKLYLLYTGHIQLPVLTPEGIGRIETQNVAISDDGVTFTKIKENPVLYAPSDKGDIHAGDFRDPKMWKHGDKYYAVIGSKNKAGNKAQMLLFDSNDLINWNFKSIMAYSQGNEGTMWECPNFAEIDGQEVIIMSPIGIQPEGKKFLNVFQAGYILGNLNYDTGIFTKTSKFNMLDYGFDFYAPQITQTSDGRCIMIGWLSMWDPPNGNILFEYVDGWAGLMTVPRELHIKDGKIISVPVPELESLRTSEVNYKNVTFTKKSSLEKISGETGELIATFDAKKSFDIELRSGGSEKTVLTYDSKTNIFKLNRDNAGGNGKGEREVKLTPADEIKLQIFLDRSSIEIFINDGEYVMSTRVYPKTTSQGIYFVPRNGSMMIKDITFYTLGEGIAKE